MKLYQLLCLLGCSCLATCRPFQSENAVIEDHQASLHNLKDAIDVLSEVDREERDAPLPSLVERQSDNNNTTNDQPRIFEQPWFDGVIAAVVLIVLLIIVIIVASVIACLCYRHCKRQMFVTRPYKSVEFEKSSEWPANSPDNKHRAQRLKRQLGESDEDAAVQFFLNANYQEYKFDEKLEYLGSRVQKNWYTVKTVHDEEFMLLTIAPVSGSCPLQLHKYQKGLNKLLDAVRVHPFIHPIERVEYLIDHQLLVMVQPQRNDGSLKDMIYNASDPTVNWSQKYARRHRGLPTDKIARYGRHILEAMMFLYSKHFPMLGHVQSGNIFVVDDVCLLGGYENTLLGYKTRLYMRCKDHLDRFDAILFGHLIFEMAAGYELTQLRPGTGEYKTVPKAVRPILKFIFEEGFPHSISKIIAQDFFDVPLPEMQNFDPASVQLTDAMKTVVEKVRKNKPRQQKMPKSRQPGGSDREDGATASSWKDRMPKQLQQLFSRKKEKYPVSSQMSPDTNEPFLRSAGPH